MTVLAKDVTENRNSIPIEIANSNNGLLENDPYTNGVAQRTRANGRIA